LLRADATNIFELLLKMAYTSRDLSAIRFELRFTWTTRPYTAAKLRHFHAASRKPRHHVMELREFNLQLTFSRSRMSRKDIQDKLCAVDHPPLYDSFDVALLRRAEIVIEKKNVGIYGRSRAGDLFELASAH
jgi:hypothetical protein